MEFVLVDLVSREIEIGSFNTLFEIIFVLGLLYTTFDDIQSRGGTKFDKKIREFQNFVDQQKTLIGGPEGRVTGHLFRNARRVLEGDRAKFEAIGRRHTRRWRTIARFGAFLAALALIAAAYSPTLPIESWQITIWLLVAFLPVPVGAYRVHKVWTGLVGKIEQKAKDLEGVLSTDENEFLSKYSGMD